MRSGDNAGEAIMKARQQGVLMSLTFAAMAATAFGQTGLPGGARNSASIPNVSGIWAHPFLTGFEPPRSGPGAVRNTSRLPNGVANFQRLVGDYNSPILKPAAAEAVRKHGE